MDLFPRRFYLDDMFDDLVPSTVNATKCDIYEADGKYHIEMDLPGYDKNDIKLDYDNNYITIQASKEDKEDDSNKKYIRKERTYQSVTRRFYLEDVDDDKVDAEFKNGILHIVATKKEKEIPSKKYIEIK